MELILSTDKVHDLLKKLLLLLSNALLRLQLQLAYTQLVLPALLCISDTHIHLASAGLVSNGTRFQVSGADD